MGFYFFIGLLADIIGSMTFLPRVTVLIISGILIGPSGFDLLPQFFIESWFETITHMALGMVGFLLGQNISKENFISYGKSVIIISIFKVSFAFLAVCLAFFLFSNDIGLSILIASIATATAPAAIYDIIKESKIDNKFTKTLIGVVSLDDLLGLIIFSLSLSIVFGIKSSNEVLESFLLGIYELGGSILIGVLLGIIIAWISGRIKEGEPTLVEAIGAVMLCVSISNYFEFSPLISSMVMGAVVFNVATHHIYPFKAIEGIEWPFMILFFLLAGASLEVEKFLHIGIFGVVYIIFRMIGISIGTYLATKYFVNSPNEIKYNLPFSLFPQAGVAIGMTVMSIQIFPEYKDSLLPIILGSTLFFEIIGPVITKKMILNSQKA